MVKFGLKKETIDKINAVFAKYPEVEEVIIYGSRVIYLIFPFLKNSIHPLWKNTSIA